MYNLDYSKAKNEYYLWIFLSIFMGILTFLFSGSIFVESGLVFILIIPIFFAFVTAMSIRTALEKKREIERLKWLAENGTLVENLDYERVYTGAYVNGMPVSKIKIMYRHPTTQEILEFRSYPIYDRIIEKKGKADLLVDFKNPNNYFVDFKIEKFSEYDMFSKPYKINTKKDDVGTPYQYQDEYEKQLIEQYDLDKLIDEEIANNMVQNRTSNDDLLNIDKDKNPIKATVQKTKRYIDKNFFEILEEFLKRKH